MDRRTQHDSSSGLRSERAIRFKNQLQSFTQISASLAENSSVSVDARNLLNVADVPAAPLLDDGSEGSADFAIRA